MEKEQSVAQELDRLPRLVDGLDLRALPIGPAEAFVLSRIDGTSTEAELASAMGMPRADVQQILTRLSALGAVHFEGRSGGPPRVVRGERIRSGEFRLGIVSVVEEGGAKAERHPGAALYNPAELQDEADIEIERKRTILDTYYQLDLLNHYELLGVAQTADKRVIKAKYYEVVNLFHPDRYYGKKLGNFKAKLERVFQRLTEAHEILTRQQSRAEYDEYLNAERRTKALELELHDEEAYASELREVQARIEAEAQAETPLPPNDTVEATTTQSTPANSDRILRTPAQTRASLPPNGPSVSSLPPRREPPKSDPDARRRALARKLGLSSPPSSITRPPIETSPQAQQRAAGDLKRRYDARMSEAKQRQVADYQARADAALRGGNLIDAVNALRIAVSLAPEYAALKSRLVDLERDVAAELSSRYMEQATYEERERRWAEAARSYIRALAGKPNPKIQERIAFCTLSADGDVRVALENARAAVLGAPDDAKYRVTLARAYLAAKMRESAIGELERAATIAPSDDSIKDLIRRVRRAEL